MKIPCAYGGKVDLDTFFYAPATNMPFDRCFYLKFQLKGNVAVKGYTIIPIDKHGKPKWTHRDYRIFLRNQWPDRKERRVIRNNTSYRRFKDSMGGDFFSVVKSDFKDSRTDVVLYIPPLSPSREYRIKLIEEDAKALDGLKEVTELLVKSANAATPAAAGKLFNEARMVHSREQAKRDKTSPVSPEFFEDIDEFVKSYQLQFNRPLGHSGNVQRAINRYDIRESKVRTSHRIIIARANNHLTLAAAQAINNPLMYWDRNANADPEKLELNFTDQSGGVVVYKQDAEGYPINFSGPQTYNLYALTTDTVNNGTTTVHGIVAYNRLLEFKVDEVGVTEVTPNPDLPANDNIKLTGIISQYTAMASNTTKLEGLRLRRFDCIDLNASSLLMKEILLCPCEEKGIKDLAQKDALIQYVANFTKLTDNEKLYILRGISTLATPGEAMDDTMKYDKRLANIKESIEQVVAVRDFAMKAYAKTTDIGLSVAVNCLKGIILELESAKKYVGAIAKLQESTTTGLKNRFEEYLLNANDLSLGSTLSLDFMTRAKLRIVPDFGFVVLMGTGQGFDLTPYLGFNINFRPIDKSVPMKYIRSKPITYYLSFHAGFTLRSLKIENKREDFFGGNSLLTGLGWRFNNYVRLSGGAAWFRAIDPNPVSSRKPVRFSPYAGVSIDLDIRELFGGINKLFQ